MNDIYSNLENYNDEATLSELQTENKELKCKLEEYAANLEKLQKNILQDFDKLSSEHKKLELNYSSLLKTARAEIERKTLLISNLNAEKDALVLKSLQNRNKKFTKNPNNRNNLGTNDDGQRFEKKNVIESHNLEPDRRETICSPKEDIVRSGTDSSCKENISHKRTNVEVNQPRAIRNRRKSMPGFGMPVAKFSSDEEDSPFSGRNLLPKERDYPEPNLDRNFKPSVRTSEGLDDRNLGNYERIRHHRNGGDKFWNHDRADFPQRHKRDGSPGRHRRRPRDAYEDHQRMEHEKYRRHDSPIDKFNQHPRRPRPNYDRAYQEQERYKTRNQDRYSKHKMSEYDEPKNKRMRPDYVQRYEEEKWSPEMQQMSEEFDKQYASCQSPDINFLESNTNHQIREIKLTANTQLDDPRRSSERYIIKKNDGKETIVAVRGMDVDIIPIPLEKSSYDIKSIKIPEALKEKPATDDLVNEIYRDIDNPLLNISMESGEILCGPEDVVQRYEIKHVSDNKEDSTKTDSINPNNQQPLANYKIPKLKLCRTVTQRNNTSTTLSFKRNDDNKSNDMLVAKNSSKSVPKIDLKLKDDVNLIDKAPISKHNPLPLLSSHTDELNQEHIKTKAAMKMVEDDLELSDETCDTDMYKTKEKTPNTTDSTSNKHDHTTETESIPSKTKSPTDNKNQHSKHVKLADDHDKKIKSKKRQHKQKSSPEDVKAKTSPTEKSAKKKVKEKEVKTKEIKSKFSELFGDSSSLISPEDLGLIAVQPPLNQPVAGIFEDALDAVDVNVKEASVNSETIVDATVVEVAKKTDENIEKPNELITLGSEKINTVQENPIIVRNTDVPLKSVYQNLEISPKPEETNMNTVIISTGVQPNAADFDKPINKNSDELVLPIKPPDQINLKALATSTPLKLDEQSLPFINAKIIETNGNTNDNRNESIHSTTDVSDSNASKNEEDVPDIRMFVKRRRKIIKK